MRNEFFRPSPAILVVRYLQVFIVLNILVGIVVLTVPDFPYELANIRNWQILLTAACLGHIVYHRQAINDYAEVVIPRPWFYFFSASVLVSYLMSSYLHLYGFKLSGMDFSIFDWMLYNTTHRQFMVAPLCGNCNHFGVHPSYIMLPLVYIHQLWPSPLMLQTVQALSVWGAGFLVWKIAKFYRLPDLLALLLTIAFWTNAWTGTIVNLGFHLEVFYLPVGLYLVWAWLNQKNIQLLLATLLFLSIKEDAAFYLCGMFVGALLFERQRLRQAITMLTITIVFAAINFLIAQPYFLSFGNAEHPHYLGRFWGPYGSSKAEIAITILTSPIRVFMDVVTSRWYWLYGSAFFIPLLAPHALVAALPLLIIYGTATGETVLRHFSMYYSAPLLPFLFWGFCEGSARLFRHTKTLTAKQRSLRFAVIVLATISFSLFGGSYLRFPAIQSEILQDMRIVRADASFEGRLVCAQIILHPHLPYRWNLAALDVSCWQNDDALILIHPNLSLVAQSIANYPALRANTEILRVLPGGTEIRRRSRD